MATSNVFNGKKKKILKKIKYIFPDWKYNILAGGGGGGWDKKTLKFDMKNEWLTVKIVSCGELGLGCTLGASGFPWTLHLHDQAVIK